MAQQPQQPWQQQPQEQPPPPPQRAPQPPSSSSSVSKSVRVCIRRLGLDVDEALSVALLAEVVASLPRKHAQRCKFSYTVQAKVSAMRGLVLGRAYVVCPEEILETFMDSLRKLAERNKAFVGCVVERAALEKVMREPRHADRRAGTWEGSDEYASFLAHEAAGPIKPAPVVVENKDDRANPLLEFMKTKTNIFGSSGRRGGLGGRSEKKHAKKGDASAKNNAKKQTPKATAQANTRGNKKAAQPPAAPPSGNKGRQQQKAKAAADAPPAKKKAPIVLMRRPQPAAKS